ncbi:MAG: type 2 isopentenyl-diphosphate Delta-isomerase, partial [Proteobacteria bacterium]|nr:type 2 isopentenyl-diphosphate Delta-isomerase [Pseudomonadota bacterium]
DTHVRGTGPGLDDIRLPYDAAFTVAPHSFDTQSRIAGIAIGFPLMFGAMTGGIPMAYEFNSALRVLASRYRIAMELGSIRPLLNNPSLIDTYGVGQVDALFANIGMSEIRVENVSRIDEICEKLGASGLCIHLNGLQEFVQDEGNHAFFTDLDVLSAFIARFPRPVLIKEVGSGIGGKCAETLAKLPIAGIETASRGGTSWVQIEALRRNQPLSEASIRALDSLGYDLKYALRSCRNALGPKKTLIASGGIDNPADFIKSLALGADAVAMAQPIYQIWHDSGFSGLERFVDEFIDVSKLIWRSTGCRNINTLHEIRDMSDSFSGM